MANAGPSTQTPIGTDIFFQWNIHIFDTLEPMQKMKILRHPLYAILATAVRTTRKEKYQISASADGGPRSRVRARGTLRSAPHRR